MYVQVAFQAAAGDPPLVVPASVVVIRPDGPQVATVEGSAVRFRKVVLGRDFGREVEIVVGLSDGDSLVANPGDRLAEGQAVQVASSAGEGD